MSRNRKTEPDKSKLIVLGLFLLFTMPGLVIPIAVLGVFIYIVIQVSKAAGKADSSQPYDAQKSAQTYQRKQEAFDDCPSSPFCFHKDKGMHHVHRGKEQDPWDRPDIDISKYQRKE